MAQTDTETTTIDGVTYTVAPLDPFIANDILIDIGAVLGPSLGALAAMDGDDDSSAELMNGAIGGLFQRLDKATMRGLIKTLAQVTSINTGNGNSPQLVDVMALHFRGKLGLMYQWLWFALKVQFADFFDLAAPAIARAGDLVGAAQSSYPSTSSATGSPID